MSKRAVLRLDGRLEEGCRVTLEVGEEGSLHSAEEDGHLPPAPELIQCLEDWQQSYPFLEGTRIKLGNITVRPGVATQAEDCRQKAKKLQKQLKAWLGSGSFHVIDTQLREAVNRDDLIRVVLRCQDRRLHLLPWHTWNFIDRYQAEVAFSLPTRKSDQLGKSLKARKKVRILAILGDSEGINTNVDRSILETLPDAEVVFLVEPLRQQLNEQLWEQAWDILFFAGHSQTEDCTGRIFINAEDSLTIDDLRFALKRAIARGLQLAIFNSCDGLGLVYELEQLGIPQLVVMRQPVPDRVAQEFLKHLLAGLVDGQQFYLAVREAREKLQSLEDRYPCASWLPVIFQNPNQPPLTWQDLGFRRGQGLEGRSRPIVPSQKKLKLNIVLVVSLAITVFVMLGRWQGHLQPWELKAYDHLMRLQPTPESPDLRLVIIRITQDDIDRLQQPFEETGRGLQTLSDRNLEKLLTTLENYKPLGIGLDLFRSGKIDQKLYPNLMSSFKSGGLVAACFGRTPEESRRVFAPDDVPSNSIGFINVINDQEDSVVRRHFLWQTPNDPAYPCRNKELGSFSFNLALRYLASKGIYREDRPTDPFIKIGGTVFWELKPHRGGYHRSSSRVNEGMQFMLNYRTYQNYITDIAETLTLTDLLNAQLEPGAFKNQIVLVGADLIGVDRHNTPYTIDANNPVNRLPGVFVHAQAVSHLLDVVQGMRPGIWTLLWWGDGLWIWLWALAGGMAVLLANRREHVRQMLLALIVFGSVVLCLLYGLCFVSLSWVGGWLPLIPSVLACLMTGGSITVYKFLKMQQRH